MKKYILLSLFLSLSLLSCNKQSEEVKVENSINSNSGIEEKSNTGIVEQNVKSGSVEISAGKVEKISSGAISNSGVDNGNVGINNGKIIEKGNIKAEFISDGIEFIHGYKGSVFNDKIRIIKDGLLKEVLAYNSEYFNNKIDAKNNCKKSKTEGYGPCRHFDRFISINGDYLFYKINGFENDGLVIMNLNTLENIAYFPYGKNFSKFDIDNDEFVIEFGGNRPTNYMKGKISDLNNKKFLFDFYSDSLNGLFNTETGIKRGLSILNNKDGLNFSDSQIQDILAKIDENTNKQQEIAKNSTGVLIQGNYKAEYIAPKDYSKDVDKIIITISGKAHEIPGVYGENEKKKYLEVIQKKGSSCYAGKKKIEGTTLIGSDYFFLPSSGDCIMAKEFTGFKEFSPSGNYLIYSIGGYEFGSKILVDTVNGKVVIDQNINPNPIGWTNDRKQFIYGTEVENFSPGKNGLFITKKGNFPEPITIQNEFGVWEGYLDDNYIYIKVGIELKSYLKIYDLNTLKEVFFKEITK